MLQPAVDAFVLKNFLPGNKCNHNPKLFRAPKLPDFKRRPNVIEDAITALKKNIHLTKGKFFERLLYPLRKNGKHSRVRSCRREGEGSLLEVCLNYVELDTMRLSIARNPCDFVPISVKEMATKTDLSPSRLRRAFRSVEGIYITTTRRWRYDHNGDFKGEIAIRTVNPQLFYDLGIKPKDLEAAREFKRGQQEAEQIRRGTYRQIFNKSLKSSIKKTVKKINATIAQCRSGMQHVHSLATKSPVIAKPTDELTLLRLAKYPNLTAFQVLELKLKRYPETAYPNMSIRDFLLLPNGASP